MPTNHTAPITFATPGRSATPGTPRRLILSVALAAVVAIGGAACATTGESPDPQQSSSSSATPESSASPVPEPEAGSGTPVDLTCEELVTPQAIYDYNPNFANDASYAPAPGSDAATIVAQDGLACAWVNETSGSVLAVAVANLPAQELDALKDALVTESNSVPTYEVEGYFQVDGAIGNAQAFAGPYWIVATSDYFVEPGDAAPIVAAAREGLGQ